VRIEARDVDFYFGSRQILRSISLSAQEGRVIGIIGPNGSGKTTLLRTLSKVLKPAKGVILLNGREISGLSQREVAKELAVVPQDTSIHFDFTAFEVVMMGRTPHINRLGGEKASDRRIAVEAMEQTRTLELRDRLVTTLSGGERQKTVIAKALAQEPDVLLLDEPTANLDIKNQIEIMELLRKAVAQKSITAIMAIHDINLAARYCDEMIMVKEGRIFAAGAPKEVLTRENISAVFDVEAIVSDRFGEGSLFVIPISPKRKEKT